MKKILTGFTLALLSLAVSAADSFVVDNISFSLRNTPIPQYSNVNSRARSGGKNRWLRVQVDFLPSEKKDDKSDPWYDDVTMEGTLVILRPEMKSASYVVLSGKTRFFTIRADGKKHQGFFYVPPVILARYCGESVDALKAVRMFRVMFYGPGRVLLGSGYWAVGSGRGAMVSSKDKTYRNVVARMKEYEKPYRNVAFLRGGLYSKEQTPWVYFDYDIHDLIYDNVQSQGGESIQRPAARAKSE